MKKLKKISLSQLSKSEINKKQMKLIKGGNYCDEKCGWSNPPWAETSAWWEGYF